MGIREYGYVVGTGKPGARNLITDVPGVKVGHCTIDNAQNQTGVTVVLPCEGLVYGKKPLAAVYTMNGYGKTMGSIQIQELGTLETPIALTNTLNVGRVADALVEYTCVQCEQAGVEMHSVNPVVGETNDSRINHIRHRAVGEAEVMEAISRADVIFAQGAVGAGAGTVCFGLKGGIGSSSRVFSFGGKQYTIGVLVQSNFGSLQDLSICGDPVGERIVHLRAGEARVAVSPQAEGTRNVMENRTSAREWAHADQDRGSIMIVLATDVPLDARQLRRVLKRAAVGLVRTGSYMGHGSGDVFLGFTNGNFMPDQEGEELTQIRCFPEGQINLLFRAASEAVQEAIYNSLVYADRRTGTDGRVYHSLREYLS